ncbi:MAG: response regulator transcription factor [Acidobacteria bacterium]|nr:response regulator transcription factor [Acidobacteriota bacterium]
MRLLLADDHAIVRRGMRALIDAQDTLTVVAEAADGVEAVALCEQHKPDIAVLDVAMPRLSGIDVAERVRRLPNPPHVIMLSMHADESYILRALNAGAGAYLLKDATDEDLLPAIQAVTKRRHYFSEAVGRLLSEDFIAQLRRRGLTDSYELLTDREKEVLLLLAHGRSNKEVAHELSVGVSTVETHRANLMQKLGLHSTAEIVLYAVRKRLIS